jgi:hypothetical protein
MNATVIDDRRRVVLPPEFKPKSAVTVQLLDGETALIRLVKSAGYRMAMLLPDVKRLPDDPAWEKVEHKLAQSAVKKLPPPKNETV